MHIALHVVLGVSVAAGPAAGPALNYALENTAAPQDSDRECLAKDPYYYEGWVVKAAADGFRAEPFPSQLQPPKKLPFELAKTARIDALPGAKLYHLLDEYRDLRVLLKGDIALLEEVSDGFIVGFDQGEFGGSTWWIRRDGGEARLLLTENPFALRAVGRQLFLLTGIFHLTLEEGEIHELTKVSKDGWRITRIAKLDFIPSRLAVASRGTLLVVPARGGHPVTEVHRNGTIDSVYTLPRGFYPNSLATSAGDVAIGLSMSILVLAQEPTGWRPVWKRPRGCAELLLRKATEADQPEVSKPTLTSKGGPKNESVINAVMRPWVCGCR